MLLVKLAPVCVCLALCFLLARVAAERRLILPDWRLSWILAALAVGVFTIAIAETLSAFNSFNRVCVAAAWLGLDGIFAALIFGKFRTEALVAVHSLKQVRSNFLAMPLASRSLYAAGAALVLILGVIALQAPTFVWDCKSYHVPRMFNWIQDENLHPFPTTDIRRVAYNPGAEIASTTLALLDGSDRPINLVSWFAVVTAAIAASFATKLLVEGLSEKSGRHWRREETDLAAALAFILVLTIPEGLVQAISTENDFVAAFWNLSLVVMVLLLLRDPKNLFYAAGAAFSLALGICTKATTFISAAPFIIAGLGLLAVRRQFTTASTLIAAMLLACAAINAPWMMRNMDVFGHLLGPAAVSTANVNPSFNPARCAANLLRDLSIYTSTPWPDVTATVNQALTGLISLTGRPLDDAASIVPYTDPRQTMHFWLPGASYIADGNGVGNIHAWLILAAFVMLPALPLRNALGFQAACVVAGFCLSCAYLRWHPWIFRLHITYFVLALPVASVVLVAVAHRFLDVSLGFFSLANALLLLAFSQQYPIYAPFLSLTREDHQFGSNLPLHDPYIALAEDIIQRGYTNILLKCELYHFDYGLWICLKDRGYRGTMQEFFVDNETGQERPWQLTPQTAMVFIGVRPPDLKTFDVAEHPQPLLQVGYYGYRASVTALYPSTFSGYWWRLVGEDNHADLTMNLTDATGINPSKPARIHFSCEPCDSAGHPVTNNIMRLIRNGRSTDFPLNKSHVDVNAIVTEPYLDFRAQLEQPLPPSQRPAFLSKLQLSWDWAK